MPGLSPPSCRGVGVPGETASGATRSADHSWMRLGVDVDAKGIELRSSGGGFIRTRLGAGVTSTGAAMVHKRCRLMAHAAFISRNLIARNFTVWVGAKAASLLHMQRFVPRT